MKPGNGPAHSVPSTSRDAILDVAEKLMATLGYERASIARISESSGLPVGSIYHHFGSKAGLLAAVMTRAGERFFAGMPQPDRSGHTSAASHARRYWLAAAENIYTNIAYFNLEMDLIRSGHQDPDITKIMSAVRDSTEKQLAAVLEPYADEVGAPDPVGLAARLVRFTVIFTRGAVIDAGNDAERLRSIMADLQDVVRSAVLQAAAEPDPG